MIDAYMVGVGIKLNDMATPALLKIAREMAQLDAIIASVNKNIRGVGVETLAFKQLSAATTAMGRNLGVANTQARALERTLAKIKTLGEVLPTVSAASIPTVVAPPRAVRAAVSGTGGGAAGAAAAAAVPRSPKEHPPLHAEGMRFGQDGLSMGSAVLPLGALGTAAAVGAAVVYGGDKFYETAKAFDLEYNKFKALGLTDSQNSEALAFVKGMKTFGVSMTENMTAFRDAQTVFRDSGSLEHAKIVTPFLAKMRLANEYILGGEHAGDMEKKFMDFLRVVELRRGLNSADEFQRQGNMIEQALISSGGRVDATQMLNLMKTGGVAAKALSNRALYYQMEPVIQEMGGGRVGTGLMSMFQNLVLGRSGSGGSQVQIAKELNKLGLLDTRHVEYNKIGMIKRILPGGLQGSGLLMSSPFDWMEQVMLPAFSRHGFITEKDVLREIGLIFSNRTASNLMSTMYLQRGNIRKGEEMTAHALNVDKAAALAKSSPQGAEKEFWAAWQDFKTEFGKNILPAMTKLFLGLAALLRAMNDASERYPKVWNFLMFIASPGIPDAGRAAAVLGWDHKYKSASGLTSGQVADWLGNGGESPYIHTSGGRPVQVHSSVNLDGRKIGESVTTHMAHALNRRANSSTSAYDPTMGLAPVGYAYQP